MNKESYDINVSGATTVFEFESDGDKGKVKKIVQYSEIEQGIYNLGFGDLDGEGSFDDKIRTNNGDKLKVILTVAQTAYLFTNQYPEAVIFIQGSTPSRTREYRIGISNNLDTILEDFNLYGLLDSWVTYEKNIDYRAFLAVRKKSNSKRDKNL
jgi:hypothetical protein